MFTATEIETNKIYQQMGMTDDEFLKVKEILGRQPNYTEIGLFSVMWSEHCSYKNTKVVLKKFPTKHERVLQGPGEGAGIVDIGDELAVCFKIESHNHPSAIEPYQGAATGVGGIIRDIFSMGAEPVAVLNSLRFGELDNPRTKYLFEEVIAGIAGYGNAVGIPTIGGEIQFDNCYGNNPLVNAMCVGLIKHEHIKKGVAKGIGNSVIYVGASTGRDGIHGATFASEELSDESEKKRPAVQVGDPFMEKLLIDACLEIMTHPALVGIQDMGAAGLISSSSEMASKAGTGIELNLDLVPQREEGMTAYEMMLSESQERMLLVVEKGKEEYFINLFKEYELHAVVVGQVTDDGMVKILHNGEVMADVPANALAKDAPEYHKPSKVADYFVKACEKDAAIKLEDGFSETLLRLLSKPTIASKAWVYSQYDSKVKTNTVVTPGDNAGVIRIRGTSKALSMTTDCNSRYVYLDPYTGGKIAIAEACANIVSSGAKPLAVTDNLNFGNPENPEIFWQIEESSRGISEACIAFDTPIIGGNVSLYNERSGGAIFPTPTIGVVGLIEDLSHLTTKHFKSDGDFIYLLGESKNEFGGSELQKDLFGEYFGKPPESDAKTEAKHAYLVLDLIKKGLVSSATDLSEGGLAVAVAECLFDTPFGADIIIPCEDTTGFLFGESRARYILSVKPENKDLFESISKLSPIGVVTDDMKLKFTKNNNDLINIPVNELYSAWKEAIPCLLK